MQAGSRLMLRGGYWDQEWTDGHEYLVGTVKEFIPGQNDTAAAVVVLDEEITAKGTTGHIVVLELRHVGAQWSEEGIVHVELCDFVPESVRWQDRKQGIWVEAAASYTLLENAPSG